MPASTGPTASRSGPAAYTLVLETGEHGGYPLLDHLRTILGGPLVWAPGVDGAVVVSLRGGDFLFEAGEDLSVGYDSHDADEVRSTSWRASVPRRHARGRRRAEGVTSRKASNTCWVRSAGSRSTWRSSAVAAGCRGPRPGSRLPAGRVAPALSPQAELSRM